MQGLTEEKKSYEKKGHIHSLLVFGKLMTGWVFFGPGGGLQMSLLAGTVSPTLLKQDQRWIKNRKRDTLGIENYDLA